MERSSSASLRSLPWCGISPVLRQKALRISQVGLRGVVGDGLTAAHVIDFAGAFGTFTEPGRPILIGRDPRNSGVMIREGVLSGLLACGHRVIDLGVVSTPVLQHAIRRMDAAGGISIGASHNTAEWNALKFFGPRGTYLSTAEAGELLDIYHLRRFEYVDWTRVGSVTEDATAIDGYIDALARVFDFDRIRGLRVVADCCNGTSSAILKRLNERCGLDLILINDKMSGTQFAHDPVISAETISLQLAPLMKPLNADAGFGFDADSDRVGIATETGDAVSEEVILPLIADWLLPRVPGNIVISNLSTTALLEHIAEKHGATVVRVPVGRQAAIDALSAYRAEQIAVAGEGSGAVMMPQFEFVYDGIASMFAILSLMRERNRPLSEIIGGYPRYHILKGEVPLTSPAVPDLLMQLQERFSGGAVNMTDGLRMDWTDRWFHVRVSQTEPIIRVICEQRDEHPARLFQDLLEAVRNM
jgi:phosphomannomutase